MVPHIPLERQIDKEVQSFVDFQTSAAALEKNHTRAIVVLHKGNMHVAIYIVISIDATHLTC